MRYTNGPLSPAGHSGTCFSIKGLSTTSWEFGFVTHHPSRMTSYGSSLRRKCNNGMA
eukprot:CCRYP_003882-RA/>CCRYP_003882-RA protein AED:0.39 eAED:1.00 QI:0/-1/0/1/-1/0/1/0/56